MTLSPDTKFKLSAGGFLAMLVASVGFGARFQSTLGSIDKSVQSAVDKINRVETKLTERLDSFEAAMSDRFTKTAAAEWSLRMLNANPSLKIPDPRDPSKFLNSAGWWREGPQGPN